MNRELFVSSTPHETKVGMVEDDQLAEIYLERENEYTLAGSIYKGRVTRVLPGMQSAFVDIGLERDAFLYVSDFMELEDSEDLDDVPTTGRPAQEPRQQASRQQPKPSPLLPKAGKRPRPRRVANANRQGKATRSLAPMETATAEVVSEAADAVEDAAASACPNRSLPGRPRKRQLKLPLR